MTRWVLGNRHAVWALVLAVGIFGVLAYQRLPVQLFPDTAPPLVNIITAHPGATAEDVAQDLSRRLEEEFASLEGVFKVKSSSQDNLSVVSVEFQYDRDVDLAAVDVQNAIARIRGELPPGIGEPQVLKFSTTDRPIVTYAVTAGDLTQARRIAEDAFAPRLQQVGGVAAVDVFGGNRPAVLVELDRFELEAARVPLQRVVEALRAHNATTPAGRIRSDSTQSMFRVDTRAGTVQDLEEIPIVTAGGSRVLLGDLALVRKAPLDDDARFRLNGRQAIAMQVFKTTEANTVEVVRATRAAIAELRSSYPGVDIREGEESASFAQTSVDNLMGNIGQAILFTAVLMLFFLRQWRTSLVVSLTMPLSFGITFAVMKLLAIDLNLVTLSAIILAVGIVIDNSVVVLENIVRRREQDLLGPAEGAAAGADEVRGAALGGTLTNIAVLVPLLFLSGFTGKTFGPLSLTLLIAFSSSIVVALVLVPLFSTYITVLAGGGGLGDRVVRLVTVPFQFAMDALRRSCLLVLRGALRQRWVVLLAALALFAGGVAGIRALGMDVLPKMDTGSFYVSLETPSGSSIEETERVVRAVEELIRKEQEVRIVQSQVGFEQGMRSLSSFGVQGPTQGFITVTLTDRDQRADTVWDVEARIREGIAGVPGVRVATVRELGNTARATTAAPIVVRIVGDDPLVLDRLGAAVEARLAGVPSVVAPMRNWRIDQRQGRFDIDVLEAAGLGVSPAVLGQMVLAGTDGLPAGDYHGDSGTPLPIRVSFREEQRQTPEDLLRFPVFTSATSDPVPLGELARHRDVVGQGLVTRENLSPTLEVSAFIEGRPLSFVVADVEEALADLDAPAGYRVELTGEKGDLAESKSEIGMALFIGIIGVYLLLVAQFRSFAHPITVLVSIPLSLSGIAAALFIAGKPVSMPVMVGLILIVGTVINSAILLLSFIEQERARGVATRDALLAAVDLRFRPIMMTSFSTIVGMIPLAAEWSLGAERFSPLAIAVIGGFATSTFLTVIFIPVLYSLFDGGLGRMRRFFARHRAAPIAPAPMPPSG
jgi:multidrug efflux pump subunit AcrB